MSRYQVLIVDAPADWGAKSLDDMPQNPGEPLETLGEADDVFAAVRQAIDYNEKAKQAASHRWAVVVEPGTVGRTWCHARVCTPLCYKVISIWWPGGWEPTSPLDVPNCVWKSQGDEGRQCLTYLQAVAIVRGLNQQSMNHAGTMWYVIVAVENEPVSQSVSLDAAGTETTVEIRRLHVVRPETGASRGDCSLCPAHSFSCAKENWTTLEQDLRNARTRSLPVVES